MLTVFGSLNADIVLNVVNMPYPGETRLCNSYNTVPGGKGANQAVAAARAGSSVKMFGAVGNDEFGMMLLRSLRENKVDLSGIRTVDEPTGCATICVDESGENMILVACGANHVCLAENIPNDVLRQSSHLLLQMEIETAENWKAIERAKANNCKVILNMAPAQVVPDEVFKNIDYLIVNEHEAKYIARHQFLPSRNVIECARQIAKNNDLTVVITLGSEGSIAGDKANIWQIPSPVIDQKDTTGAGDAYVGNFAAALDSGESLLNALAFASTAGALACLKEGAQTSFPTVQETSHLLGQMGKIQKVA